MLIILFIFIYQQPELWNYASEISNEYSQRWLDSNHTHFWFSNSSYYSYSKFEVLIVLILNNAPDVLDCDSSLLNIYKNHKINMSQVRTLRYSPDGCVFVFFLSYFFVHATTTKTVNFDEWFESHELFMSIISSFLNLWIWMSRGVKQILWV